MTIANELLSFLKTADDYQTDSRQWPDPTEPRPSMSPPGKDCTCPEGHKLDCPLHGLHPTSDIDDLSWSIPENSPVGYPQDQPRGWTQAVSKFVFAGQDPYDPWHSAWETLPGQKPWQLGVMGKGMFVDGKPYLWDGNGPSSQYEHSIGGGHHFQVAADILGKTPQYDINYDNLGGTGRVKHPIWIENGDVESATGTPESYEAWRSIMPREVHVPDEHEQTEENFNFSKCAHQMTSPKEIDNKILQTCQRCGITSLTQIRSYRLDKQE